MLTFKQLTRLRSYLFAQKTTDAICKVCRKQVLGLGPAFTQDCVLTTPLLLRGTREALFTRRTYSPVRCTGIVCHLTNASTGKFIGRRSRSTWPCGPRIVRWLASWNPSCTSIRSRSCPCMGITAPPGSMRPQRPNYAMGAPGSFSTPATGIARGVT